jgi:hypothetical protein
VNPEDAAAVERHALPVATQYAGSGPPTAAADPADAARLVADNTLSITPSTLPASDARDEEKAHRVPLTATNQDKTLNLRIARDSERCPKVVCYKWHLITQRLKPPQYTKVELAGLRLAPGLRRKVENGNVDLLIDAVTKRKTIHGHDTLVFVAVNLTGVTPHDAPMTVR